MTAFAALLHYGGCAVCAASLAFAFCWPEDVRGDVTWTGIVVGACAALAANVFTV